MKTRDTNKSLRNDKRRISIVVKQETIFVAPHRSDSAIYIDRFMFWKSPKVTNEITTTSLNRKSLTKKELIAEGLAKCLSTQAYDQAI